MRRAPEITLTSEERKVLTTTARSGTAPARAVCRARIILKAAEGLGNQTIALTEGTNRNSVARWRRRFAMERLTGLYDRERKGRPHLHDADKIDEIVGRAISEKPTNRTHWSTRAMAEAVGVSKSTVSRVWRANHVKPHLVSTFKLSNDKQFTEKLRDVIGLYLNPPDHALVLCVDEKSQIQALDRTQPGLPMKRGKNGTRTHDYVRHGTCCLFAALNVLTGEVLAQTENRHRHQEYLRFLRLIDQSTDHRTDLHLIADNYGTHKHHKVTAWLQKHPRFHVHFIPTSSSWLNLVERFFGKITNERIRRGVFHSVLELIEAIHNYIEEHNQNPKPFIWTKDADVILAKLKPIAKQLNKQLH